MADLNESYWTSQFDITNNDLDRLAEYIQQLGEPCDLTTLSKRIVRGRLRFGHDISPKALSNWAGQATTRLWDPAGRWGVGDNVIVVRKMPPNDIYETFIGTIIEIGEDQAKIHLTSGDVSFLTAEPGSEKAVKWHNIVRETVAQKMQSADLDDRVNGILAQSGDQIVSRITAALEHDARFIGNRGYWFLAKSVPVMDKAEVEPVFRFLLGESSPCLAQDILARTNSLASGILAEISLNASLSHYPQRFHNLGSPQTPLWRAVLPEPGEMMIAAYAYDPQTFEILCAPGESLSTKAQQRLKETHLLEQVIEF